MAVKIKSKELSKEMDRIVEIRAEYYLEPISHFLFVMGDEKNEINIKCRNNIMFHHNFYENIKPKDNSVHYAHYIGVEQSTLPGLPFVVEITSNKKNKINAYSVLHEVKQDTWREIPLIKSNT